MIYPQPTPALVTLVSVTCLTSLHASSYTGLTLIILAMIRRAVLVAVSSGILMGITTINRCSHYSYAIARRRKMQLFFQFSLYIGCLTIVIGFAGILGNTLSVLVLQTKAMKSCFNDLLNALNISDRSSNSLHFSLQILFAMA